MNKSKVSVLLIGPYMSKKKQFPIGGTFVSFKQLVEDLKESDRIYPVIINTSRRDYRVKKFSSFISGLESTVNLLKFILVVDIVTFHASSRGIIIYGPIVFLISKIFRKPLIIRSFGGNLDLEYKKLPKIIKYFLNNTVFSSNICLFQTYMLLDFFKDKCKHKVYRFKNTRKINHSISTGYLEKKHNKFIFVGIVKPSKGIKEIIKAAAITDIIDGIDVYGPLQKGMSKFDFEELKNVKYCGILPHDKVIPTLKKYKALILPTYYSGEGHPGVIKARSFHRLLSYDSG